MKSRSHHQRNTPATTPNSWPVDLSVQIPRCSVRVATRCKPNLSASQKWDLLKGTLKSAAETTIGRTEPRHKNPHCQDIAAMSETQRKLRLQINNTRNPARKQAIKQQRNRILHAQRRRARDNASVRLDHLASDVKHLHDGAKMFRAVREMVAWLQSCVYTQASLVPLPHLAPPCS